MISNNYLSQLPNQLKALVLLFLIVLSIGYFTALIFVNSTTNGNSSGLIENYNGNEDNADAFEMKFRKSSHEMLNIIHTHILSMSIIFFLLGLLVYGASANSTLKGFLMIEPLVSVLVTFGGIYMIWSGIEWMSTLVMLSGGLMTISFTGSVVLILFSLLK